MKYKIGDKVVFIKKASSKEDAWPLVDYEEYIITHRSSDINTCYGVKSKEKYGDYSTWYEEQDFIGLKEYRKLKLERINKCNLT